MNIYMLNKAKEILENCSTLTSDEISRIKVNEIEQVMKEHGYEVAYDPETDEDEWMVIG